MKPYEKIRCTCFLLLLSSLSSKTSRKTYSAQHFDRWVFWICTPWKLAILLHQGRFVHHLSELPSSAVRKFSDLFNQTEIKKTNSSDSRLNSVKYLLCKFALHKASRHICWSSLKQFLETAWHPWLTVIVQLFCLEGLSVSGLLTRLTSDCHTDHVQIRLKLRGLPKITI